MRWTQTLDLFDSIRLERIDREIKRERGRGKGRKCKRDNGFTYTQNQISTPKQFDTNGIHSHSHAS